MTHIYIKPSSIQCSLPHAKRPPPGGYVQTPKQESGLEGAIGMVWNHLAVKSAIRRSNFLCSRLAVPLRIVPGSR